MLRKKFFVKIFDVFYRCLHRTLKRKIKLKTLLRRRQSFSGSFIKSKKYLQQSKLMELIIHDTFQHTLGVGRRWKTLFIDVRKLNEIIIFKLVFVLMKCSNILLLMFIFSFFLDNVILEVYFAIIFLSGRKKMTVYETWCRLYPPNFPP